MSAKCHKQTPRALSQAAPQPYTIPRAGFGLLHGLGYAVPSHCFFCGYGLLRRWYLRCLLMELCDESPAASRNL
jgi:hypothetical protein